MKITYLGDGLYADFDSWQVRIFSSNGEKITNEVFLEPEVLSNFLKWIETLKKENIL